MADHFAPEPITLGYNCFKEVDIKTLRWSKNVFVAPKSEWKEDDALNLKVVMTPVEYFLLFFDNQVIDLIRNQTELYAAKIRYGTKMYGRAYQNLH